MAPTSAHDDSTDPRVDILPGALRYLTVPQAAAYLAISRAKLYQLLSNGAIDSLTIGRSRRIPINALDEFIGQRLESAT